MSYFRNAVLSTLLAGGLLQACSYPRIPNRYRSDLTGRLVYAEGNDGKLAAAVKVSVPDVQDTPEGRVHIILFENVSRRPESFEYQTRWYNRLGLLVGEPSVWKRIDLSAQDQVNMAVVQPVADDLTQLEVTVKPLGK